ncbi:Uncharacterized protein SCF082_LOCUS41611, partial [Durusdinium trenchii]
CALRLEYVPKIGAPANSSALVNPGNVKKALEELQRDLPGHMEPNEELVRVMIEKVIAEERMKTLLAEYQKSWDSAKSKVNKAKEALRPTTSPRSSRTEGYAELRLASPSTSTASWEQVTLRPTPAQEPDYLQYLNEDEKMRLMDLVHQRAQQQAQQVPLPNDTDPENMEPNYEAAMNLIHMLNEDFKKNLAELVYDGKKPYVWEMFCSPNSTITQCCEREGLNGVRIGLSTGFDLYKDQTYEDLKTVFKKQKPKKIWAMIHYDLLKNRRMILKENNLMLLWLNDLMMNPNQHLKTRNVKVENSEMCIKAITMRWLLDKPRPKVLCPDNAKSLTSQQFVDFFGSVGIQVIHPPDQEPWAHGVAENAINLVKTTASKLQFSMPDQDPVLTLASATSAINNTEFNKGFTSFQWAFGRQASVGEEELRRQLMSPLDRNEPDFAKLLNQRQLAEDCARKAKAAVVLSKLKNTSIRQPIRTYHIAQPVMLWWKFLKTTLYKGRKGGKKHVMRPRWVGPGRVVLHEWVPGQGEGDRVQIAWVVIGSNLYRASIHSIRPLSEREQLLWEAQGDNSWKWKELKDMLPGRAYTDVTGEEPKQEETLEPLLPKQPNEETYMPKVRFHSKDKLNRFGFPGDLRPPPLEMLNDYEDKKTSDDDEFTGNEDPSWKKQKTTGSRRSSTTSKTPLLDPGPEDGETKEGETRPGDTFEEPDAKRPRTESDKDDLLLDLNTAIQEIDCGYVMEFDLNFTSNRQRKMFMRNPQAYLVKKVSGAEVCYRKLNAEDRKLFDNAKVAKEIRDLIIEVRREPTTLRMWRLDDVEHWQDTTVVTLADQAHANRPKGDSTGGLLTCLGGKAQNQGEPGKLNVVAWRTWRLRRKAISTNDGEIQCILEGEDHNYRYDPQFIQSEKRARQQGKSAVAQMRELQCLCPGYLPEDFEGMTTDAFEEAEAA